MISVSDGETVVVRPGTRRDGNNDPVLATGAVLTIEDCVIEPLGSEESTDYGRDGTITRVRVYTPAPVVRPILETDIVELRGKRWEIEGFPDDWYDEDPDLSGPVFTASRRLG